MIIGKTCVCLFDKITSNENAILGIIFSILWKKEYTLKIYDTQ